MTSDLNVARGRLFAAAFIACGVVACAETEEDVNDSSVAFDSGYFPPPGASSPSPTPSVTPSPGSDAGGVAGGVGGGFDARVPPRPDAGPSDPFGGFLGGWLGDGGGVPDSSVPPPRADGGAAEPWTLDPMSAPECPDQPPEIPIIGGPCLGIYYGCGWSAPDGAKYSCVCDWIHWLCI